MRATLSTGVTTSVKRSAVAQVRLAIPEPSTLVILLMGTLVAFFRWPWLFHYLMQM